MDKDERHVKELLKRKPPLTVVNAIIQNGEEVLLIKRGKEPGLGTWVLPGGHVETNEDLEEAVIREVKEETGLAVGVVGLIDSHADKQGIDPRGYHLVLTFLVSPVGGNLKKTSEAVDIGWFKLNDLPNEIGLDSARYFQKTITSQQQISELVRVVPPMPMVNQIVYKDKTKIFLGKRNKPPYFSSWGIPGGHLGFKESGEDASRRKVKEETGFETEIERFIDVYSDFGIDPRSTNFVVTYLCRYISGDFVESRHFSDFVWWDLTKDLPNDILILNTGFKHAIQKAKKYLLEKEL